MSTVVRQGLSVAKAASLLGVGKQTVRNLYRQRELEGYTVGRKVLIFEESLATYQYNHSNELAPEVEQEPAHPVFAPKKASRRRRGVPDYDRHFR